MQSIIYKNGDNSVCILAPADGCELSIEQIARKDVPAGTSYDIVDAADLAVVRGYDGKFYMAGEEPTEPAPTLEEQLAAIEAKYTPRIAALREGIMSAYLTDGVNTDDNVFGLRTEWAAVIAQRNAEMEALLI